MCGRSIRARWALLLLLLFASTPALAKKHNFSTGLPIGFAFIGGAERTPISDFTQGQQHYDAGSFGKYYAGELFLDFVKFVMKGTVSWHFAPALRGSGFDTNGAFNELSNASTVDYGIKIMLAPFFSADSESRTYFALGAMRSSAKIKTTRSYLSGREFTEQASGTGTCVTGGMGFEWFIMGNYTFQIEGGYQSKIINDFVYAGTTDIAGNTVTGGSAVVKAGGGGKSFKIQGAYGQAALMINF